MFGIVTFAQDLPEPFQLIAIDEFLVEGNFFGAGDVKTLSLLDRGNELTCRQQAVGCPGVEPGISASHSLNRKSAVFEVYSVHKRRHSTIGYLSPLEFERLTGLA